MRPYSYQRPATLATALSAAAGRSGAAEPTAESPREGEVHYLAGGTNLLDLMKIGVVRPHSLVDIKGLRAQFGGIEAGESGLKLGALVHMAEAANHPLVRRDYPAIHDALRLAASTALRNMATLGGNVLQRTRCSYFRDVSWPCNKRHPGSGCAALGAADRRLAVLGISGHCIANYPGDLAHVFAAFGARLETVAPDGSKRTLLFEDLHRLPGDTPHLETNLTPGELITGFEVPAGPWTRRSLYVKVRDRESYDFALASAAVGLDLDPGGVVREARIGIGGLTTKPWRSYEAEKALRGMTMNEDAAALAAHEAFKYAMPGNQSGFKPELGRRTLIRALLQAAALSP